MPKIFVLPKRMTKPVELDGTLEKTAEGLIVKDVYGTIIGTFDADCQWWKPEPPEPPVRLRKVSPATLDAHEQILKAMRAGTITDDQCALILAIVNPSASR